MRLNIVLHSVMSVLPQMTHAHTVCVVSYWGKNNVLVTVAIVVA